MDRLAVKPCAAPCSTSDSPAHTRDVIIEPSEGVLYV